MPPIVQRACVEGSTGKNSPCWRSAAFRWPSTRPGSTSAVRGLGIDVQDAAQMLRAVDHQRAVHRLAALAGAAAAGQHRDALLARDRQRGGDVVDLLRHDHADGLDLVDRRVGGIAAAIGAAEQHLAADFAPQPAGQARIARRDGHLVPRCDFMRDSCARSQRGWRNMPGEAGHARDQGRRGERSLLFGFAVAADGRLPVIRAG